jgi:hypothetical protein
VWERDLKTSLDNNNIVVACLLCPEEDNGGMEEFVRSHETARRGGV